MRNWDSSVRIVLTLRGGRLRNFVPILGISRAFSFLRNVQTETEALTGFYSMGKEGDFCLGVNRSELEADHLPPFSAAFKNV